MSVVLGVAGGEPGGTFASEFLRYLAVTVDEDAIERLALAAYASKHGAAQEIAERITEKLAALG
jgi:hypothetical protein